jgi:hypothetical protein
MSFAIYVIGFLILIGGLVFAAVLLHMPLQWVGVCALVLVGLAVLTGVKVTRHKDPAA